MGAPKKFPNREPLARSSDDSTSHEAAEDLTASGKRDTQKRTLLEWMIEHLGGRFLTAREIAIESGLPHEWVHKRLSDLTTDGYLVKGPVTVCSITRKRAGTWVLAPKQEPEEPPATPPEEPPTPTPPATPATPAAQPKRDRQQLCGHGECGNGLSVGICKRAQRTLFEKE